MKHIYILLAALTLVACNRTFEEHYPQLMLDKYDYTLSPDGGSLHLMVYYSDSWTAELSPEGKDWIQLSRTEAPGQAYIRMTYASAVEYDRYGYVDFYPKDGEPVQLKVTQIKKQ